ncbi:dynein regulatory complex protein 9 [Cotesia glomerata]|uniref:dynein regulatory complex protein 9 n=1 Tax=Cotesia glomerata TaxID=32391 RepID=UPI001D01BBFD|nr:dynein regulatory complex protein 9 [Cotesia glomerata]XP_044593047.1 dynein regulatory complex protein 9 [Cotesia glomerata]
MEPGNYCRLYSAEKIPVSKAIASCIDALAIYQNTLVNFNHHVVNNNYNNNSRKQLDQLEILDKLKEDSLYVRELLEELLEEVEESGSFSTLIKLIENNTSRENNERDILVDYEKVQEAVKSFRKTLREFTIARNREMEALKAQLITLRMEKEKLEFKNELETQYASGWEKAQCEQSSLRCSIILKGLNTSLQDWLIRGKNERRVAREIEAFLKQNILANENAAERWRNRYNQEIKAYETKNNKLRSDIKMKLNRLEMLEDKFKSRQEFIDAYLAEKEAKRVQKEKEDYRRNCSIKIQSWWRGVMVRRKLGPYRLDEKKKKRATKNKK